MEEPDYLLKLLRGCWLLSKCQTLQKRNFLADNFHTLAGLKGEVWESCGCRFKLNNQHHPLPVPVRLKD